MLPSHSKTIQHRVLKVYDKEFNFSRVKFLSGPSEDEKTIADQNGVEIARVLCNLIFIPFELLPKDANISTASLLLRYILEKASDLLSFDNSAWVLAQKKVSLANYIKAITGNVANEIKQHQDKIIQAQNQIASLVSALQGQYAVEKNEQEIHDLLTSQGTKFLEERAKTDFEKMEKLIERGLYENIQFLDGICTAITGRIYITYQEKSYFVGRFRIEITDSRGAIYKNLEYKTDEFQHPHIKDSKPCYGKIEKSVAKLLGRKEFPLALEFIYRFLSSYNHNGAFGGAKFGEAGWIWKKEKKNAEV
jgi:hypothetical protein